MTTYTTIAQVKADNDFTNSLILSELSAFFIYRGSDKLEYYVFKDGQLLFSGNDLTRGAWSTTSIDGLQSFVDLLGFITVQPGDTNSEYFYKYSPAQMAWAESFECELLKGLVSDFEDRDYQAAADIFNAAFNNTDFEVTAAFNKVEKVVTIDVDAKEWFDKLNGNSYFSAKVTVNYNMPDQKTINIPFEYGYGEYYRQAAMQELTKDGFISESNVSNLSTYCRTNNITLRANIQTGCKKADVKAFAQ